VRVSVSLAAASLLITVTRTHGTRSIHLCCSAPKKIAGGPNKIRFGSAARWNFFGGGTIRLWLAAEFGG